MFATALLLQAIFFGVLLSLFVAIWAEMAQIVLELDPSELAGEAPAVLRRGNSRGRDAIPPAAPVVEVARKSRPTIRFAPLAVDPAWDGSRFLDCPLPEGF